MSWGATAYTPIRTYNTPPFGFHEVITPPDFKVCNENPWSSADNMKDAIHQKLREHDLKTKVYGSRDEWDLGYDYDHDKLKEMDHASCGCTSSLKEGFAQNDNASNASNA